MLVSWLIELFLFPNDPAAVDASMFNRLLLESASYTQHKGPIYITFKGWTEACPISLYGTFNDWALIPPTPFPSINSE